MRSNDFEKSRVFSLRYSHSANVVHDTLWLLGGMNANERRPPGLCQINLVTGEVIEHVLPVTKSKVRYFELTFSLLDDVCRTTNYSLQSSDCVIE